MKALAAAARLRTAVVRVNKPIIEGGRYPRLTLCTSEATATDPERASRSLTWQSYDPTVMTDAVERYCAATEAANVDAVMETLTDDAELVSPISGRVVFRGRDDLRVLLSAVYGSLTDLRWTERVGDGDVRVAIGETRIAGLRMTDAMVFHLAPDGRIQRIGPHLRPWLALTMFAPVLVPKVVRHPGVVRRALGR